MSISPCIIIPIYNHPETIVSTVASLSYLGLTCIIVDDGSDDHTQQVLKDLSESQSLVYLDRLPVNQGKGGAVMRGLELAYELGFTHALQIDADGQHNPNDVPKMLKLAEAEPLSLVCGQPVYDESVPKGRLIARYLTHFWVCVETLNWSAPDSMCGFRVYPLESVSSLIREQKLGRRMDFDIEVLVRLIWKGVPIARLPTQVIYPENGMSHFNYIADNWLISKMHTRLFFSMLGQMPNIIRGRKNQKNSHWSEMKERGGIWGISFLLWVYRILGRKSFDLCLLPVTAYFYLTNPQRRNASLQFLSKAHLQGSSHNSLRAKPGAKAAFKHFWNFGQSALDRVASILGDISRDDITFENRNEFIDLANSGTGGVIIGSHLGNIELSRVLAEDAIQKKMNILVFTEHAVKFNNVIKKINNQIENNIIHVDHIGPDTAILLKDKIDAGELIVILGDRTAVNSDKRINYVDFLGSKAPFSQGPFILSSLLACPVYLMFCLKDKGRHHVYFESFSERISLNRKKRNEELQEIIQSYAQRLEYYCLKYPLQWFNFFDFWADGKKVSQKA